MYIQSRAIIAVNAKAVKWINVNRFDPK